MVTEAPSRARPTAMALPIPSEEPVTTATLFSSCMVALPLGTPTMARPLSCPARVPSLQNRGTPTMPDRETRGHPRRHHPGRGEDLALIFGPGGARLL